MSSSAAAQRRLPGSNSAMHAPNLTEAAAPRQTLSQNGRCVGSRKSRERRLSSYDGIGDHSVRIRYSGKITSVRNGCLRSRSAASA